jgi:hypothetical protein
MKFDLEIVISLRRSARMKMRLLALVGGSTALPPMPTLCRL